MAIGDIYQIQMYYNIGSELTMNVLHVYEDAASDGDIPAQDLLETLHAEWEPCYNQALFSQNAHLVLLKANRIWPAAGIPSTLVLGTTAFPIISGSFVGGTVPSQAALLVSIYTLQTGRTGRGRHYLPGVAAGAQEDGQVKEAQAAGFTLIEDFFEDGIAAIAPKIGGWRFGVYSRKDLTHYECEQALCHTNLATQRSRRNHPGIGV